MRSPGDELNHATGERGRVPLLDRSMGGEQRTLRPTYHTLARAHQLPQGRNPCLGRSHVNRHAMAHLGQGAAPRIASRKGGHQNRCPPCARRKGSNRGQLGLVRRHAKMQPGQTRGAMSSPSL